MTAEPVAEAARPRRGVYQPLPGGRALVLLVVVWISVSFGVLLEQELAGGIQADWWFTVLMLLGYAWAIPQFLLRVVCELHIHDGAVTWKTAIRSGQFEASELRSLRPMLLGPNAEVIRLRSGQKLFVMIVRGFREFAADLADSAPFAQVEVGRLVEVAERWPGQKSYYKREG